MEGNHKLKKKRKAHMTHSTNADEDTKHGCYKKVLELQQSYIKQYSHINTLGDYKDYKKITISTLFENWKEYYKQYLCGAYPDAYLACTFILLSYQFEAIYQNSHESKNGQVTMDPKVYISTEQDESNDSTALNNYLQKKFNNSSFIKKEEHKKLLNWAHGIKKDDFESINVEDVRQSMARYQ
ncbi:hypothetical protein BDF14DRAFT_1749325 [Spinellus fusiger]|nr:hypothetical protein BDF14DRAFT_1749325 [Spinellus fusiger]